MTLQPLVDGDKRPKRGMLRWDEFLTLGPEVFVRFWAKVDRENGPVHPTLGRCWVWTAFRDDDGYGMFAALHHRQIRSNRFSYMIAKGEIPPGLMVLHSCHNAWCCNPDHLRAGTPQDNSTDMVVAGHSLPGDRNPSHLRPETRPRGEDNPRAVLTEDQVRQIRARQAGGETMKSIAKTMGLGYSCVVHVVRRRVWLHVA